MRCEVSGPWVTAANVNRMQVSQHYPAEWTDVTGQRDNEIVNGANQFVAQGVVSNAQLTALLADSRYVVLWSGSDDAAPPTLTAPQVDALKTKLTAAWSADVAKLVTLDTVDADAISGALKDSARRPPWQAGIPVGVGSVYQYDGNLFECIQGHNTQSDWTPPVAPALWKRFYEPSDDPWPWVQPTGAHDAYPVGARVTHNGSTWSNVTPANVWEPGTGALWTNETPAPPTSAWAFPVAYTVGQLVTYQGNTYSCRQAHTSQSTWQPPNVPALWLRV